MIDSFLVARNASDAGTRENSILKFIVRNIFPVLAIALQGPCAMSQLSRFDSFEFPWEW